MSISKWTRSVGVLLALLLAAMLIVGVPQKAGAVMAGGWEEPVPLNRPAAGWLASGCNGATQYTAGLYHIGRDYWGSVGASVRAIGDGVVLGNYSFGAGFARAVFVRHKAADNTEFVVLYGHIDSGIAAGRVVKAGESLGSLAQLDGVGSHLHLGLVPKADFPPSGWGRLACPAPGQPLRLNSFTDPIPFLEAHPRSQPAPAPRPDDHNHDGWPDMYAFNRRDAGSGRTVHYVFNGQNCEQVIQVGGSPFGWLDANWNFSVTHDWNGDGTPDFVAVNKHDPNSGKTVYYVLDGTFPERVVQVGATPFGWTDQHWVFKGGPDFNRDGRPEIYAFDRQDEGTGRTVVFILNGVSPEQVLLISRTPFGFTDGNWDFAPGPDFNRDGAPDLYAFNKRDPGTGRTVHYVLDGRNPEHVLQVGGSPFGWLDSNWSLFPSRDRNHDGVPDMYAVNRRDTGSGKTVFYVLDGTSPERIMIAGALGLGWTDEHWDFGVW